MKTLFFFLIITWAIYAQQSYQILIDEKTGKQMIVGECTRDAFLDTAFAGWYNQNYKTYEPDEDFISQIEKELNGIRITIVMATWCGDTKREVPRFLKILDLIDFPEECYTLLCVDRKRKGLKDEVDELDIQLVPTFIFYKDGEEIGRIIETPQLTLEEDFYKIILQKD